MNAEIVNENVPVIVSLPERVGKKLKTESDNLFFNPAIPLISGELITSIDKIMHEIIAIINWKASVTTTPHKPPRAE